MIILPRTYATVPEISELYFDWNESRNYALREKPARRQRHLLNDEIEDAEFVEIEQEQEQDGIQS